MKGHDRQRHACHTDTQLQQFTYGRGAIRPGNHLREGEALVRHLATATRERVLDTSESQHSSCIAPMLAQQTIWRSPTS